MNQNIGHTILQIYHFLVYVIRTALYESRTEEIESAACPKAFQLQTYQVDDIKLIVLECNIVHSKKCYNTQPLGINWMGFFFTLSQPIKIGIF